MNLMRAAGYHALGLSVKDEPLTPRLVNALRTAKIEETMPGGTDYGTISIRTSKFLFGLFPFSRFLWLHCSR